MERRTIRSLGLRILRLLLVGMLLLLPMLGIAYYFLFVESLQVHFDSDQLVLQYELVGDASYNPVLIRNGATVLVAGGGGPFGGPVVREITLPISWILYSVSGLIACGIAFALLRRRKKLNSSDPVHPNDEDNQVRWRPRFQFSLRTFLIAALLLGVIFPATIYRARTVLERQRMLRMGYYATYRVTQEQLPAALRRTSMASMWQALTYVPGPRWGKPSQLKISAPTSGTQDYRIIDIDPQVDREQLVMVEVKVGSGASGCSLDLFAADVDLTGSASEQNQVRLANSISNIYDMRSKSEGIMLFRIKPGESFQLGVTGNWMSPTGSKNDVEITIRIDDF